MSRSSLTRLASAFAIAGVLAACADTPTTSSPAASSIAPDDAPAFSAGVSADVVPGRFIVTLRSGADARGVAREHGVAPDFVYSTVLNGFAGSISDAARAGLLRDARVERVEQDGVVTTQGSQSGATWGLDRTNEQAKQLDGFWTWTADGSGVTAYIIDTGILTSHTDFGGRASGEFTAVNDGNGTKDCNGHGTHVAGTVGGATYGIAKGVKLVAVRVLDCSGSGSWSGVIAGMDYVAKNHSGPSVANMSLGGGASSSVDAALDKLIASGVTVGVAAGNGNRGGRQQDACNYSPARVAAAITVGATDRTDTKTSWSNYGPCVDIFAPGSGITSDWIGSSNAATNTISGTSMATPHVVGVAALYLSTSGHGSASPATVAAELTAAATQGIVKNSYSSPHDDLLYSSY